jgi:hypothetical protein
MNPDPATVSVIVSGCVGIAAILSPVLVSVISDWQKWRQERKAAKAGRIDRVTIELLDAVSPFTIGTVEQAQRATSRTGLQLAVDLQRKYYVWERVLWSHCKKAEREQLRKLRIRVGREPKHLAGSGSRLADDILALAHAVAERIS